MKTFIKGKTLLTFVVGLGLGVAAFSLISFSTIEKSNTESINDLQEILTELNQDASTIRLMNMNSAYYSDPYLGEIAMFAGNFPPRGWAFCDGSTLNIPSNGILFSLLGTTYGGDGKTTFGLPDLRGRMPLHPGGTYNINLGQSGRIKSKIMEHERDELEDKIFTMGQDGYTAVNFIICTSGIYPARH